jgi:tetratricopeptide (TPR) repeat protein
MLKTVRLNVQLGVLLVAGLWLVGCIDDTTPDAKHASNPDAGDSGARKKPPAITDDAGGPGALGDDHRPEGVALCYSDLSSQHAATGAFWGAILGGKLDDRAAAIDALTAAGEKYPDEEEFALLLGLAHLWRVAEPLPEQVDDMAGFVTSALGARTELERAYALCPTDHRIPAWLGPILVNTGRALKDDATVDEGLKVLQQGIDHYPAFVLFSKLLVYADRPKDDPDFQNALDALTENVDLCTAADPACSNHAHAAHNFEGASVFMGDVLAKAGKRAEALAAYEMAKGADEYPDWDYSALLDERIKSIDDRIAAFDDADPANDPEAAWTSNNQCSICHRQ